MNTHFVMAALEAAIQLANVSERKDDAFAPADAGALGGRVKPGHDEK